MAPKTLYKYRDWENNDHKKIITENKVWLSSPKGLNDPFDCQLPLVIDEDEIKSEDFLKSLFDQVKDYNLAEAKQKEICENPREYFKQRESEFLKMYHSFGVFSLCESPTNYLLWSYYANSHSGFCIGFNTHGIVKDVYGTFENVTYQLKFPVFKFLGESSNNFSKALATKHQQWEFEKEWRITKIRAADTQVEIDSKSISEIYFGVKMMDQHKKEIINCLKDQDHLKNIKLYEMRLSDESFTVIPKEIKVP